MKQKITFLQFCIELRRCKFTDQKGVPVPKYILYWSGYLPEKLILNQTKFNCIR